MAANTRTTDQREADLEKISLLLLKGKTQSEIAQALGLTRELVKYDINEIRKRWKDSSLRDFDAAKQLELEKVNLVEREAWEGWELSLRDAEKRTVERTSDDAPTKTKIEQSGQSGNPRYLEVVTTCVEQRCKILGLHAPKKIAPTNLDGDGPAEVQIDLKGLTNEQLKMIVSISRQPGRFTYPPETNQN